MTRGGRQVAAAVGPGQNSRPADDLPAFTLGAVNVSPMSMAAAYATVAARGHVLHADRRRQDRHRTGARAAGRRRRLPPGDTGRCGGRGQLTSCRASSRAARRQAWASAGPPRARRAPSDNVDYAAFAGYTPDLAGYVSVFNPIDRHRWGDAGLPRCPATGRYRKGLPGRDVRRDAPGAHLADDVRARGPGSPARSSVPGDIPPALVDGRRRPTPPRSRAKPPAAAGTARRLPRQRPSPPGGRRARGGKTAGTLSHRRIGPRASRAGWLRTPGG